MHLGSNSEEEIQSLGGNVYKYSNNSNNPIKGDSSVYVKIKIKITGVKNQFNMSMYIN